MVSITSLAPGMTSMLPPPLPITKRPTNLKRDSSYLDTDDENDLSLTAKKLKVEPDLTTVKLENDYDLDQKKVTFDNKIDTKILDDAIDEKPLELIKEEVKWAIHYHLRPVNDVQEDERYMELVNTLKRDEDSDSNAIGSKQLLKHLIAFETQVNNLGECGKLVKVILDQDWLGRDDTFVATYIKLLVSIASAHSKYLSFIIERLLQFFTYLPSSQGRIPGERVIPRSALFQRVHKAIKTILRRVPAANGVLVRVSKSEYPGESETSRKYAQYQRHLLRVGDYAPEVKSELIAGMVQRVVALDVEVQLDIEELEEEVEERLLHRRSHHHEPEESDESDESSSSDEDLSEEEERMKEIRLKVAKIDCTMDILFEHYDDLIKNGSQTDADDAYKQLLSHFTTFIMPNRTRHVQFLLFHFAQISTSHMDSFAGHCMSQGFAPLISQQRLTAIAYLASFIARGAHVPKETVQMAYFELCKHLDKSRKAYETECRGPDRRKYPLYYAIAQALLYIFCFRWRDLTVESDVEDEQMDPEDILAEHGELNWLPGIKAILDRNVTSPLNPLKVCAPAVVSQFAGIARHTRFMEIITIIEKNKRLRFGSVHQSYGSFSLLDVGRRETAIDRKQGDSHHQMEPYFPFDPYHLPNSKRWVEGDYVEWQLPKGMRDQDDDDESDDGSDVASGDDEFEFDDGMIEPNLDSASISS